MTGGEQFITVRLPLSLYDAAKNEANTKQWSLALLMRIALREYLERNQGRRQ